MNTELSELEFETLCRSIRHPLRREDFLVVARIPTGAGVFVTLNGPRFPGLADGTYSCNDHLEMEGLEDGLVDLVFVEAERVTMIEYATIGEESWDGVERPWAYVAGA